MHQSQVCGIHSAVCSRCLVLRHTSTRNRYFNTTSSYHWIKHSAKQNIWIIFCHIRCLGMESPCPWITTLWIDRWHECCIFISKRERRWHPRDKKLEDLRQTPFASWTKRLMWNEVMKLYCISPYMTLSTVKVVWEIPREGESRRQLDTTTFCITTNSVFVMLWRSQVSGTSFRICWKVSNIELSNYSFAWLLWRKSCPRHEESRQAI